MPNEISTEKVSVNMNASTLSEIDLLVDNGTIIAQALGVGVSSVTRAAERAKKTLKKFL